MKWIIITIGSWVFFAACSDERSVTITDFSHAHTFDYKTSTETLFHIGENVEAVFIDVKGQIDGNVRITGSCGGDVAGKVDTTFRCDWYSPESRLYVMPLNPQVKGQLKICFRFSKI